MSSINSIGSTGTLGNMSMLQGMRKPDPAAMADKLFSKLDTSGQGYIEKTDLQSAFASISDTETDVDSIFSQLDTDSDGKVTQNEFSNTISQLAQQLDEQFQGMRMQQGMAGMMGGMPPPPADDTGFTKDELTSQLDEIGSTDSAHSTLISSIVENFDTADTDGDGKVNASEAMAYAQSAGIETAGASGSAGGAGGPMGAGGMPPPPADDTGFTKDELTSQLSAIDSTTDSARASLLSSIVQNFDAADTDGDGKVSFREAMAYKESGESGSTSSSADATSANSTSETQLMQQIMRLVQAYNLNGTDSSTTSLSVTA
jgi:Ca2+-binding EF-hand superfamily protein